MADTIRYGNQYRIAIGLETAFNSGATTAGTPATTDWHDLVVLPGILELTPVVNTADTQFKTGSFASHPFEQIPTTSGATVNYRGDLCLESSILFDLFFNSGVANTLKTVGSNPNATPLSAVIYMIHNDYATSYACDKVQGCKCTELVIESAQGGLVTVNATFEAAAMAREVSQAITGTDPRNPAPNPAQFADVNATLGMGAASTYGLESFGITLTNVFTSDGIKFANNRTMSHPLITGVTGEIRYTCPYNATGAEAGVSYLNDPNAEINDYIRIFNSELKYIDIVTVSIPTSIERPIS